jgi:hypothetical protein
MTARGLALVGLLGLVGCLSAPRRHGPAETRALLKIGCPVSDAMLWIDDTAVGEVHELPRGVRLRPGEHRIEVRHDRYHTRYFRMTLRQGEERTLRVSMAEVLD